MDERETRPPDCSRGKCHSLQLACIPPEKEPELEQTIWWQSNSRHFTIHSDPGLEMYIMTMWRWGSVWSKLIAHHLSVQCRKSSTVQLSLWEAVSEGQWIHPISSPPCSIWFNRERRGPQTELWECVQQQCGQVVNTPTWRGRAGLQTGLISLGLSRPADRGGGERDRRRGSGDLGSFYSLISHQLPLSCRQRCHLGCPDATESPALKEAVQWSKRQTNRQTNAPGGWSLGKQLRPTNLLTPQFSIES